MVVRSAGSPVVSLAIVTAIRRSVAVTALPPAPKILFGRSTSAHATCACASEGSRNAPASVAAQANGFFVFESIHSSVSHTIGVQAPPRRPNAEYSTAHSFPRRARCRKLAEQRFELRDAAPHEQQQLLAPELGQLARAPH